MTKGIQQAEAVLNGRRAAAANANGGELERLLAKLKASSAQQRDDAARSLGDLGDPRAATSLAEALSDRSHEVQWSAAAALAKLGDPRAADFYLSAIRSGSRADRWAAVWTLGNSLRDGDRRALGPLREAPGRPRSRGERRGPRADRSGALLRCR